ncbi:1851_t:CDS:2, partial [Cetraspora pellucida]
MVPQDSEYNPLIGHNTSEGVAQHGNIPTPTGPTKFNMAFVSFLFASCGALLFAGTVWYITSNAEHTFFIWHPTLMALTLLMATFGILILQTTAKQGERNVGLNWHKLFQTVTFFAIIAGFTIIITYKNSNNKDH